MFKPTCKKKYEKKDKQKRSKKKKRYCDKVGVFYYGNFRLKGHSLKEKRTKK